MPGLPPRPRSPATTSAASGTASGSTPPASPRHIPHAAQPPSPGIGAVSSASASTSPATTPQSSPRAPPASAAADALAQMAAIAGGLGGLDLGPAASSSASSPGGGLPPRPTASPSTSQPSSPEGNGSGRSGGPPPNALRRQDSFGPSPDGTNPKHPNVPPPPPELDSSAKHIPLPDEHTRRTMEGEAMIFKPKKIRRPSLGGKDGKGGKAGGDSKSIATAKTTASSSSSTKMSHRRHPSLPNLADSRRLRSDLLHKLGIDNSKAMAAGGVNGMPHAPGSDLMMRSMRGNLPPGAVGGSSQTGRASLLGGVASHDEPLKYREDRVADGLERNAWKRFFGLGNNNNDNNNNEDHNEDAGSSSNAQQEGEEGGNANTTTATSTEDGDKQEEQKLEMEMEPDPTTAVGGASATIESSDKQEGESGSHDAHQQEGAAASAAASAVAAASTAASTAEEEKENTASDGQLGPSSTHSVPTTRKERKRITFREQVRVTPIPMRSEYSHRIRDRLWTNRIELHENAQRNALEFASEGWDWRTVTEDEGMYRCSVSGELIHPVHCQQNYENYEY